MLYAFFEEASKLDHVENLEIYFSIDSERHRFKRYKLPQTLNNIKKVTFLCYEKDQENFLKEFSDGEFSYEIQIFRQSEYDSFIEQFHYL